MPQQRIPIRTHGAMRQEFVLEASGESYVKSEQDCTPLLEENARLSNAHKGASKNGTAIAARVPAIYRYAKWPIEFEQIHGVHPDHPPPGTTPERRMEIQAAWAAFYKRKLNDRDFRKLRTDGGKRL